MRVGSGETHPQGALEVRLLSPEIQTLRNNLESTFRERVAERARLSQEFETLERGWGEVPPWVFCAINKTPIAAHDVRQAFKRVLKATGLPSYFTVHCLRHTFATPHLEADQGRLLYVSRQLGHSSISITADVYAKWLKPTNKAAADSLATDAWTAATRA